MLALFVNGGLVNMELIGVKDRYITYGGLVITGLILCV